MKLDDGQHDQPLKQVGFISSECAKPSEINLTHCGGFFLEELSEFGAWMLDMPRQPLEHEIVSISRSAGLLTFGASLEAEFSNRKLNKAVFIRLKAVPLDQDIE